MSKNPSQIQPLDGCMVHAGILQSHGGNPKTAELTKGYPNSATEKFIDEVINELVNPGTDPLPCGKPIPPLAPNLAEVFKDLKDEKKFPDFHKNILGNYRDLARSLEVSSNFNLFPVCDPIALGTKLFPGVNLKIEKLSDFLKFAIPNPVALAAEFAKAGVKDPTILEKTGLEVPLTPIGLLAAFAKQDPPLKKPPAVLVPPVPPTQEQLISGGSTVQIPWQGVESKEPQKTEQPYDTIGPDLAAQIGAFGIKIKTFLPQLIASMPVFVINMITKGPAAALNTICGLVADDSGLVGVGIDSPNGEPQDIVMRAARKVLARKVTEMCVFHAMANTIGTSKSGLVGLMAGGATDKLKPKTEDKSGLIADYTPAAAATDNYLVNEKQKGYFGGKREPGDYITFTNPPITDPPTAFNDPWRHRLILGDPYGNTDPVVGAVYEPRGSEANDDYASELYPMLNSNDLLEKEFGEANLATLQEKDKSNKDTTTDKARKNKALIDGTKEYKASIKKEEDG